MNQNWGQGFFFDPSTRDSQNPKTFLCPFALCMLQVPIKLTHEAQTDWWMFALMTNRTTKVVHDLIAHIILNCILSKYNDALHSEKSLTYNGILSPKNEIIFKMLLYNNEQEPVKIYQVPAGYWEKCIEKYIGTHFAPSFFQKRLLFFLVQVQNASR